MVAIALESSPRSEISALAEGREIGTAAVVASEPTIEEVRSTYRWRRCRWAELSQIPYCCSWGGRWLDAPLEGRKRLRSPRRGIRPCRTPTCPTNLKAQQTWPLYTVRRTYGFVLFSLFSGYRLGACLFAVSSNNGDNRHSGNEGDEKKRLDDWKINHSATNNISGTSLFTWAQETHDTIWRTTWRIADM